MILRWQITKAWIVKLSSVQFCANARLFLNLIFGFCNTGVKIHVTINKPSSRAIGKAIFKFYYFSVQLRQKKIIKKIMQLRLRNSKYAVYVYVYIHCEI